VEHPSHKEIQKCISLLDKTQIVYPGTVEFDQANNGAVVL
jgi:hypothetical protein